MKWLNFLFIVRQDQYLGVETSPILPAFLPEICDALFSRRKAEFHEGRLNFFLLTLVKT